MSDLPLDPVMSKCVLAASMTYNCVDEMTSIIAMLNVPQIFIRPRDQANEADRAVKKFEMKDGDHLTMLRAYQAFIKEGMDQKWCWNNYVSHRAMKQAHDIKNQLLNILKNSGCPMYSQPAS